VNLVNSSSYQKSTLSYGTTLSLAHDAIIVRVVQCVPLRTADRETDSQFLILGLLSSRDSSRSMQTLYQFAALYSYHAGLRILSVSQSVRLSVCLSLDVARYQR